MLQTFINIVHVFVCLVLIGVVLLQQGKGGGMGAAFGGATTQVFGGRGAGNILTRATAICAATFMLTSVSLAYLSSSGDRALKAKIAQEAGRKKDKGQLKERPKETAPAESAPAPTTAPAESAPSESAPAPAPAPAPTTAPSGENENKGSGDAPAAPAE
ncbi:MAG TPA: preprotein translocase subunit SecG [Labilithrix sp.]|nr:preprotein translocase subunit SecG [Labilithrix sp.]